MAARSVSPTIVDLGAIAATQSASRIDLAHRTIEADSGKSRAFQIEEEAAVMLLSARDEIYSRLPNGGANVASIMLDRQERGDPCSGRLAA